MAIKKILVMKECCIGDVLMTTPLLSLINRATPNVEIHYAVGSWSRSVLDNLPILKKIWPYPKWSGHSRQGIWNYLSLIKALRHERFDEVYICDVGRMPQFMAWLMGIPVRRGFNFRNKKFALTHWINREVGEHLHEIDSYLLLFDIFKANELKGEVTPLTNRNYLYQVTTEENNWATGYWQGKGWPVRRKDKKPVIAISAGGGVNPGTTLFLKRWPLDNFIDVVKHLTKLNLSDVIWFIAPGEEALFDKIHEELKGTERIVQGITLRQMVALLGHCDLFVCNDSGPMHLAAAVGVPTISLWGPTDPQLLAPRGERHIQLEGEANCRPCYRQILGTFEKCSEELCIGKITPEQVLSAIRVRLPINP